MERVVGIYVPGLGDDHARGQGIAIKGFAQHGIDFAYHAVGWGDGELWAPKQERLVEHIDRLYDESGQPIIMMASSAGASAFFNAAAERPQKVGALVSICGKIQNPHTLETKDFDENPAFEESLNMLHKSVRTLRKTHTNKVLSLRPLWDGRVPVRDTEVGYGQEVVIPMVGHVASIAVGLVCYKRRIARFARAA